MREPNARAAGGGHLGVHVSVLAAETVTVLDVPFAALAFEQAVVRIRAMVQSGAPHQVVLANAHALNLAFEDPRYHQILREAALVLRDGAGVEIGSLLAGKRLSHNFVGTDFVPRLLGSLTDLDVGVFLYGAAPGIAERAAQTLCQRCPGIRIVGTAHGYGNPTRALERMRRSRPEVLLVALGNPLQERWIARHLHRLPVKVAIGVGALFDYLAETVPRAPRWVRAMRGEWAFRLLWEPRRLCKRYLIGNPVFLWRLVTRRQRAR